MGPKKKIGRDDRDRSGRAGMAHAARMGASAQIFIQKKAHKNDKISMVREGSPC